MSKGKRLRKIKSGNKRVKKAIALRDAMWKCAIVSLSAAHAAQIAVINAAKLKREGVPSEQIKTILKGEK